MPPNPQVASIQLLLISYPVPSRVPPAFVCLEYKLQLYSTFRDECLERLVMKIILSRKGFDAGLGGVASPIFPSGALYSLPIPESFTSRRSKRYKEIQVGNQSLGTIVNDLTGGRVKPDTFAHLDPDLNALSVLRQTNWRPVFGQAGAAEKHLQNQGVKEGDVFVFYGWFRQVELNGFTPVKIYLDSVTIAACIAGRWMGTPSC
jgi:hypothetical protein